MSNLKAALLVITDRPEYLERTLASAKEYLPDNFAARIVINDERHVLGFAGAIQRGWNRVLESGCSYVFHLEDDFTFNAPVPVEQMIEIIEGSDAHGPNPKGPRIAQVALKRQPWNDEERAAGGIVELDPDSYKECRGAGGIWTEHRKCFTTNPSVYPASICERGWPQVPDSEGAFTHQLLADDYRFAFLGGKNWPPFCEHIGEVRAGKGY